MRIFKICALFARVPGGSTALGRSSYYIDRNTSEDMARKKNDKSSQGGFISRALSATGDISAKRLTGFLLILACIVCIIWLTATEGGTDVVESLLQTSIITGCSLLGLSSVTSIWRKGRIQTGGAQGELPPVPEDPKPEEEGPEPPERPERPERPCRPGWGPGCHR